MAVTEKGIVLPNNAGEERVLLDSVTQRLMEVVAHVDSQGVLVNPATSDKQLPDNHQVSVSNHPSEFPLPAAQVATLTPPAAITGFSRADRQDPLAGYVQIGFTNMSVSPFYMGFMNTTGAWYIRRTTGLDDGIHEFVNGPSGFSAAWAAKAGLTYSDATIFA